MVWCGVVRSGVFYIFFRIFLFPSIFNWLFLMFVSFFLLPPLIRFGECFEGQCRETHKTQCHLFGDSEPCTIKGYECVAACMLGDDCLQIGAAETDNAGAAIPGPCRNAGSVTGFAFSSPAPLATCPVKAVGTVCAKNGHTGTCNIVGGCTYDNPCAEGGKCCTKVGGELLPKGTRWASCNSEAVCEGDSAEPVPLEVGDINKEQPNTGSDLCTDGEHCNADGCCEDCADYQRKIYQSLDCSTQADNRPYRGCVGAPPRGGAPRGEVAVLFF